MGVYVVWGPDKMPRKYKIEFVSRDKEAAKKAARETYEKFFQKEWYGWANRVQIKRYVGGRDDKVLHQLANELIERNNKLELSKISMSGKQKVVSLGRQTALQNWAAILRNEKDSQL